MRPRKKRLTHVLNILKVIADRDSKVPRRPGPH